MRRFLTMLLVVALLPLKVSAAYAGIAAASADPGHACQSLSAMECQCEGAGYCAMHRVAPAGVSHGTAQHHHCTHTGAGAAVIPAVPMAPLIPPSSACPESERVSFHSIVLDVPSPPPTRLA